MKHLLLNTNLVAQRVKNLPAMQRTWVWFLGWEDPLEKGMAIHTSILAWRIPWSVGYSPGRLQSTGSQRVGHDWVTSLSFTFLSLSQMLISFDKENKVIWDYKWIMFSATLKCSKKAKVLECITGIYAY